MKRLNNTISGIFGVILLLAFQLKANAVTINIKSNKNWSTINNGSGPGGQPSSSDNIVIKNDRTLTVDVTNAVCANIDLGGTGSNKGFGKLTFSGSGSPVLTVSGNVQIGAGKSGGTNCYGNLTMVSGATLKCQDFSVVTTTGNTYTAAGTIELTATNSLPATIITSFNNLTLNHASGTTSLGVNTTISGTLTITNGLLNIGAFTLTLQGEFSGSSGNALKGSSSSNLTISGSGTIGDLYFDQTTDGTTNKIQTLTVNRSGETVSIGNNLVVSSSLTLTAGKFDINGQLLTLSGDFSGSSTNCLVGSQTSDLTINGSGSLSSSLYFDQTTASDTALDDLVINRSGVTITLGNTLKLFGVLTPTAGTLASGGNLVLVSDASGTATVANGSGSIAGNVIVQRYIPSSARRWRFLSSPVTSTTVADWQGEIHITGTGGASNGFDATSSNAPGMYSYDETIITGDLNTGWTAPSSTSVSLTPGKGYRVFVRGSRSAGRLDGTDNTQDAVTLALTGSLNLDSVVAPVSFTSSGTLANDGWNLVGNPYAAGFDWNAFHDAGRTGSDPDYSGTDYAHLDKTIYMFDGSSNSYVSYNAEANSGTLTNGIVPSGASFFIKASAASPNMKFRRSYVSSNFTSFFKNSYVNKDFRIKLVKDSINSDEVILKYIDDASLGRDKYDIEKMWGAEVNISAISAENAYQALQSKPFNGATDTTRISVYFKSTGNYTMSFFNAADFSVSTPITLIDKYSNTLVDLRKNNTYTFAVSMTTPATYGDNRFLIVVGELPQDTVVVNPPPVQQKATFKLYPTVTSRYVTIMSDVPVVVGSSIEIRNVHGSLLKTITNPEWQTKTTSIDLENYKNGLYFITIRVSGQRAVTLKCIKRDKDEKHEKCDD